MPTDERPGKPEADEAHGADKRRWPREAGSSDLLEIAVELEGSAARVVARGEVDLTTAPDLDAALVALANDDAVRLIVVDLGGVTFLDSSGLHLLWRTANSANRDGFDFRVARAPDHIRRLFVLTRFDRVIQLVDG